MISIFALALIAQTGTTDGFAGYRSTFLEGTETSSLTNGRRYIVKPSLAELENGDILSCYSSSEAGDTLGHDVFLRRSTNRGAEWGSPEFFFDYGMLPDGSDSINKGCGLSVVPGIGSPAQVVFTQTVKCAQTFGGGNAGYGPFGERRVMPFRESRDNGHTWSATTTPIRTAEWASSGGESAIQIVGNECWHVYYDQERGDSCEAIMLAKAVRNLDGSCPLATAQYGVANAWSAEIVLRVCFLNNHNRGWRVEEPVFLKDPYNKLDDHVIIFRNSDFHDFSPPFPDRSCYAVMLPKNTPGARWSSQPAAGPVSVPNPWLSVSSPNGRRPAEFNFDECADGIPIEYDSVQAPGACRARRLFPCSSAPKGIVTASGMVVVAVGDASRNGRGVLRASTDNMTTWLPALEYGNPAQRAQQGVDFLQPFPGTFLLFDVQETVANQKTRAQILTVSPSEILDP